MTGLAYKKLTGGEMKKYEGMASKDKERYKYEKEEYDRSKSQENSKPDSSDDDDTKPPAKIIQRDAAKKTKEDSGEQENKANTKRRRKTRDPNLPKKSRSAYLYFAQDYRTKLLKDNKDIPFGEIVSAVPSN